MKIQLVSLTKEDFKKNKIGRWYYLPEEFVKQGHKVHYNTKKNFWRWYLDYLTFRPDVVISFGLVAGFVGMLKKIGFVRKPFVLDWNDYFTELSGKTRGITRSALLEYSAVSAADLIITPGKFHTSVGKNLGKKIFQLKHGVREGFEKKDKVNLKGRGLKLMYIGEQSKYKRAFELVKSVEGLNCTLYMLGSPDPELQRIAPNNVVFIGRVNPFEVYRYINSVDVCIDSQDQDSSLKVIEYIFKEKPIIGLSGRKSYMFRHLDNIYLTENFKEAIQYLIKNPKELKRISENVKKIRVDKWSKVASDYVGLIRGNFSIKEHR